MFKAGGTWPRTSAIYCHPVDDWPADAQVLETVQVRSCVGRGAAIDLVLDRGRETVTRRPLPAGDYAVMVDERLVATVERKSIPDLVSSISGARLKYAMADLAALPHAAVVVEDRYAAIFKQDRVRPAVVADALAELQVTWPAVPIAFADTRPLAEQWTYRYLAAAAHHAGDNAHALARLADLPEPAPPPAPEPTPAEIRAWARTTGLHVSRGGRIPAEIRDAYRRAHAQ